MRHITLFFLSSVICAGCVSVPGHVLFDSGKSDYSIVVDGSASECVNYAAEELQSLIKEISGVTLPITDLSGGRRGRRLVVGYNSVVTGLFKDVEEPDGQNDSFTYRSKGGDVCFWGDSDRGTLYAVYSLMEKEFGCRWYSSKVSVIPRLDRWSFSVLDNHEEPALRMRNDFYYDVIEHPEFAAKLRSNSTLFQPVGEKFGGSVNYWGAHTLLNFVPVDKYFASHPEYFSEIGGKRISDRTQLCLSNPEVLELVIGAVREKMRNNPEFLVYSISQGDWYNPCECEECRKIKEQYGNEESGILLWFVNQVADAVKDEFPDKYVGTFAYQYTRAVPQNIKPRDNVVIRLCSIEECQFHDFGSCEWNQAFVKDMADWSAIAPHLYIWDYTTAFTNYLFPQPNIWTFQDRIRRFRDNNAIGVMPEGNYNDYSNAFEIMKTYLLAKLMWDPDCDADAVIKDFTDGFFGPAAGPVIREYLDFERAALVRDDVHEGCFPEKDTKSYPEGFITDGRKYFERAVEAVRSAGDNVDEYVARVEYAEVALCFLQLVLNPKEGMKDGSLDLFLRVAEREGISMVREHGFMVDDFLKEVQTRAAL